MPQIYLPLLDEWEHGPPRPGGYTHIDQLKVAWTLLHVDTQLNAARRLHTGTQRACHIHGSPERYDPNLTQRWFDALASAKNADPSCELAELLDRHPQLSDSQAFDAPSQPVLDGHGHRHAGTGCVICRQGRPLDVIAELATTWISAPPRAPLPGYLCVVAKRHATEPFHLNEPELSAFWTESMAVAAVLSELLRPSKMNYEIHGNTIPHLHLHLYPRFVGDPFEGRPIDGRSRAFHRSPEDLARLEAAVARLG